MKLDYLSADKNGTIDNIFKQMRRIMGNLFGAAESWTLHRFQGINPLLTQYLWTPETNLA